MKPLLAASLFILSATVVSAYRPVAASGPKDDVKEPVQKGLSWLAKQQADDGSWSGNAGNYPTAVTALAGIALLMEGSTTREGKYAANLRKAVAWYLKGARANGLLVPAGAMGDESRYMLGHGFGLLFLSCAYGEEEDADRRKELEKVLTKAVKFAADAQTKRGGWGYVAAAEGNDFDEGFATVVVYQALLAARKAGIAVPRETLTKAEKYFDDSTDQKGGVVYSLATGGEARPIITAGVAACGVGRTPRPEMFAKWVAFAARTQSPDLLSTQINANTLMQHFYFARVAHALGDEGYRKIDPDAKNADLVKWTDYRKMLFKSFKAAQTADGNWEDPTVGSVFATSVVLIILQLENEYLPALAR